MTQVAKPIRGPQTHKSPGVYGKKNFYWEQSFVTSHQLFQGHIYDDRKKRLQKEKEVRKQSDAAAEAERKLTRDVWSIIERYEQEQELIREKRNREKEQKDKLAEQEKKEKQLRKQAALDGIFRNRQKKQEVVSEQLAAMKKEKAASAAEEMEWKYVKAAVKREAEDAKWMRLDEDRKLARLKAISAHRQNKMEELKMKEEAERQSDLKGLQDNKEADRLFLEESEQKGQLAREENIRVHNYNNSLAAKQRAFLEQEIRSDRTPVMQKFEAMKTKHHKVAEEGRTRQEVLDHKDSCTVSSISKQFPKCALRARVDELYRESDGGVVPVLPS